MRTTRLPRHVVFRLLALPYEPDAVDYAITATETSCGVGFGDFCAHCAFPQRGLPSCSLFGGELELEGEVVADAHLAQTERVVGGATKLKEVLAANPAGAAVLNLGPELLRSPLCLAADAGKLGRRRGLRMIEAQAHLPGSPLPGFTPPPNPTHTMNQPRPLTEESLWPLTLALADREVAAQRAHVQCFRHLADLLEAFLEAPAGERYAREFRAIADETAAQCDQLSASMERGDRDDVALAVTSCVQGYCDGLARGQWGDDHPPMTPR